MATAKEEATGLNASEVVSQHGCLLSGADGAPDQLVEGAQLLEGDLADVLEDGPNHVLGAGRGRQRSAIPERGISFTRTRGFAIPPNFDAPVKLSSDVGKQECEGEGRPYDVGGSRLRDVGKDVVEVIQIVADGHVHLVKGGEGGETVGRVGRLLGTAVLGVVVQDLDLHRELRLCIER